MALHVRFNDGRPPTVYPKAKDIRATDAWVMLVDRHGDFIAIHRADSVLSVNSVEDDPSPPEVL